LTGVEGVNIEHWITKDCDSISWIGGEGTPSRDKVKDNIEHKQPMWVSVKGNDRKISRCMKISVQILCTCMCVSVEIVTYIHGFAEG
jgi:hypothetical protein